jgi:CRP/FNR family transcriptional regulator, cyclic AMP receptor protein
MAVFRNRSMKVEALRRVPMFATLPKKDLDTLARYTTEVDRPSGTVLITQDQAGQQMMYLEQGTAVVKRNNRKIAELGPGDVIGELSLIDGQPASATVTTTSDVVLLVMSVQDFGHAMNDVANFPRKLLQALAARLRDADNQIVA